MSEIPEKFREPVKAKEDLSEIVKIIDSFSRLARIKKILGKLLWPPKTSRIF